MEFSSSSDEDEAMERQLLRQHRRHQREEAAVVRARAQGGARHVTLPSGRRVELRKGTVYIPVRDLFAHVNEAKARPERFFGDPSVRIDRRPPMPASHVVLMELTRDRGWCEVLLPAASVTGVFVFDRIYGEAGGQRGSVEAAMVVQRSPSPSSTLPVPNASTAPVSVGGASFQVLPSTNSVPPWNHPLAGDPCLQRKVQLSSWVCAYSSPMQGFVCTRDVVWPISERLCDVAAADARGTVWGFRDCDRLLSTISLDADDRVLLRDVARISGHGAGGRALGLLPPAATGLSDSEASHGAAVLITQHSIALVWLPYSEQYGGEETASEILACPDSVEPYGCWCATSEGGLEGVLGLGGPASTGRSPAESCCSPLVSLAVSTERCVHEVRFERMTDGLGRWSMRQARVFPRTRRVTALGTVGNSSGAGRGATVLLSGMRNGTIQVCHTNCSSRTQRERESAAMTTLSFDASPRHHGASVVSLRQLSTHEFQFASVASDSEVRVWDLRYFSAKDPVAVRRIGVRLNYDAQLKVSWCGDVVALVSERAAIGACLNAAHPSEEFKMRFDGSHLPLGNPTVLLSRSGLGYQLLLLGDQFNRVLQLEAL